MGLADYKINAYQDNIVDLSDRPADDGISAAQLKAFFDSRTDSEVKDAINGLIDALVLSGASQIGANTYEDITATNVQGFLNELAAKRVIFKTDTGRFMRVATNAGGSYLQISSDGITWNNLSAVNNDLYIPGDLVIDGNISALQSLTNTDIENMLT